MPIQAAEWMVFMKQEQQRRKQPKKGMGCLIVIAIFIVIFIIIGIGAAYAIGDIKGKDRKEASATITIEKGAGTLSIGETLQENGIIKNASIFRAYVKFMGVGSNIQYGDFEMTSDLSYSEIIEKLEEPRKKRDSVRVTFPEGSTVIQFAQRMADAGLCTTEEFIDTANNGDFSQFTFWNKIGENDLRFMKAEGYLFPNTYDFFKDDTVYNMVAKLYQEFDKRVTAEMYARMDELNMTLDEVITLSSFVQEEAGHPSEQPFVSAVLHNRLKPGSVLPRLECNVCSLIMEPGNYVNDYIVPYYGGEANVPDGMLSAYNTYKLNGLPAGPISCPGEDAIINTLYPEENFDNLYFVTDLSGKYYYSKTLQQHNINIAAANKVNASLKK